MAQALGVRLLDPSGDDIPPGGGGLTRLDRIDATGLDPRLTRTAILVACDVANPLCGPAGASAVYGPQKGADPALVAVLDANLAHLARTIRRDLGRRRRRPPRSRRGGGPGCGTGRLRGGESSRPGSTS